VPDHREKEPMRSSERSRRRVSSDRLLDAALELIQRWGYKKTTMDDIAKQAGVAKKTLYLHWKTREALFETLLLREWLSTIQELRQRLLHDPAGATLSAVARHVVAITASNPLFRAMLFQDREMLGDLTRSNAGQSAMPFRLELTTTYLKMLRNVGLLRTDSTMEMQMKMIAAIFMGYLMIDQFLPPGMPFPPEEMAQALVQTLHRTVEPDAPFAPEAVKEVTRAFDHQLGQLADLLRPIYEQNI
jgi:AcrR family transcriptional regulator